MNRTGLVDKRVVLAIGLIGLVAIGGAAAGNWHSILELWCVWNLKSPEESRWKGSADRLVDMKSVKAILPLVEIIRRENELPFDRSREEKIRFLSESLETIIRDIESGTGSAVPALLGVLKRSEDSWHLQLAAYALVRSRPHSIPGLRMALRDEDIECRVYAAWALGKMGPAANDALPELIHALHDPYHRIRFLSAFAMGNIGTVGIDGINALYEAIDDENELVSEAAYGALEKLQWPPPSESMGTSMLQKEDQETEPSVP